MPFLEFKDVVRNYPDFTLSLSFSVEQGKLLSVIGPSGAGKSTLLALLSGQENPDSGQILLNGKDITKQKIQKRRICMIFQDFSLFPSMDVEKNICYGMRRRGAKERKEFCQELLGMVGLSGYGSRSVTTLSGGEAQRVALARALAAEPELLLLDEALSALDPPMRRRLRGVIRSIHDQLGMTMIHVTHDIDEAFAISDEILMLKDGKVEGQGTAEELYNNPSSLFSAFFTGNGTALPASLIYDGREGSVFFRPESAMVIEEEVNPAMHPMHIVLNNAEIISADFTGAAYILGLDYQGYPMLARSPVKPRRQHVSLMLLKDAIHILT